MRAALKRLHDPSEANLPRLDSDPRYRALAEQLAALEARLQQAVHREQVATARKRGQQPTATVAERAKRLVSGGTVISLPPDAELLAAAEEQSVLREAIIAKREELAALASELAHDVCGRFAAESAAAYRQVLEAVTALHAGLEFQRLLRASLISAGYELNDSALPMHLFPAAAALGDPNVSVAGTNPAASFRQWAVAKGIIE